MDGTEPQEISRVGQTVLVRLMESQIWHLPAGSGLCGSVREGFRKGTMVFLGESCSPAFTLMPDTSVPPHETLVTFRMLHQCWSLEQLSLHKSMCGFFKRNSFGLQQCLPLTQSPLVFCSQKLWGLTFLALEPWVEL